jgi:hypothetical protein
MQVKMIKVFVDSPKVVSMEREAARQVVDERSTARLPWSVAVSGRHQFVDPGHQAD